MIFVTGASGLIGSFVCRRLLEKGYSLKALKRPTSDLGLLKDIQDSIEWVEGDLLNVSEMKDYLKGVKKIVHCAAFVSYDSRDKELMQQINVEGTANLVNAAIQHKVSLFLHISSVASIGKDKNTTVSTEKTQWTEGEKTSAYAMSKHQSELEVWRGWAEGLKTIIINPSLVLGPGNWDKSSTQLFKYVQQENRFYTSGMANYVDVRDVAEVTVRLLETALFGERFIVTAGTVNYKELFENIARELDKKPPHILVKGPLIRIAIMLEKIRSRLSGAKPLITDEVEQVSKTRHVYANDKVKRALGIDFYTLQETVAWTCQELMAKSNGGMPPV